MERRSLSLPTPCFISDLMTVELVMSIWLARRNVVQELLTDGNPPPRKGKRNATNGRNPRAFRCRLGRMGNKQHPLPIAAIGSSFERYLMASKLRVSYHCLLLNISGRSDPKVAVSFKCLFVVQSIFNIAIKMLPA